MMSLIEIHSPPFVDSILHQCSSMLLHSEFSQSSNTLFVYVTMGTANKTQQLGVFECM